MSAFMRGKNDGVGQYFVMWGVYTLCIFPYMLFVWMSGIDNGIAILVGLIITPILSGILAGFVVLLIAAWQISFRYITSLDDEKSYKLPLCLCMSVSCLLLGLYLGHGEMQEMPSLQGLSFFLVENHIVDGERVAEPPMLLILIRYLTVPSVLLAASVQFWRKRRQQVFH